LIAMIAKTGKQDESADEPPSALGVVIATAFAAFLSMAYLSFRPATLAIFCWRLLSADSTRS